MAAMSTTEQLAAIPAVDIALLAGGRVADLGCASGRSVIDIALAYPEALVDGFDDDGTLIDTARAEAKAVRLTGRVAFRHVGGWRLRPRDLPTYDVVIAPERLRDVAEHLAGDTGVVVVRAA